MRLLFIVKEVMAIKGRGMVLRPGVSVDDADNMRVGDKVELRQPGGMAFATSIEEIMPERHGHCGVYVPIDAADAAPRGTEVWWNEK